jgi:iron complex transport system permease protein
VALQALLRNPLAEPYILGLSTGAGLGVLVQGWVSYAAGRAIGVGHTGAILGAAATTAVVLLAGRRRGAIDPLALLLVGVVVSTINGAVILLLSYLIGPGVVRDDLASWMMGSLNPGAGGAMLGVAAGLTAAGLGWLVWAGPGLDVATLGDDEARALGVRLGGLRLALLGVSAAMTGAAVVLAGPIAFVGLIGPHVARLLHGPGHRPVAVSSAVVGAVLLVVADVAGALLAQRGLGVLPVGIFTALIGGPAFIVLLRRGMG